MVSSESQASVSPLFVEALSLLMAWQRIGSHRARVSVGSDYDPTETVFVDADPMTLRYTVREEDLSERESFDGFAHTITYTDGTPPLDLTVYNVISGALAARLAFPLSLSIWRPSDSYRFTGDAIREGDCIVLGLVHNTDPALRGTLSVSVPLRQAVQLDTPTLFLKIEEIIWL